MVPGLGRLIAMLPIGAGAGGTLGIIADSASGGQVNATLIAAGIGAAGLVGSQAIASVRESRKDERDNLRVQLTTEQNRSDGLERDIDMLRQQLADVREHHEGKP